MTDAPRQAFGPSRRIRKKAEFDRAFRNGRRVTSPHFLFVISRRDDDAPARLGLVVSRKAGNAVARNRIKRLCREAFRRKPERLPPGLDILVLPRAGVDMTDLDYARVDGELEEVCGRLRNVTRGLAPAGSMSHVPSRSGRAARPKPPE